MFRRVCIAAAAISFSVAGAAHAAVVTTFSYSGHAQAGGASAAGGPGLPSGGVLRANDPFYNYASSIANGQADPLLYAAGAAAAGNSSASSNLTVTVRITNDTGVQSTASLSALIFAGGVGIANPNFADPACAVSAIEACGAFLAGTPAIQSGQQAALSFAAQLDGSTLFGGAINVDSAGKTANFSSGFALNAFGADPINGNVLSWQETLLSGISLGTFLPGEMKTLQFLVSASVLMNGRCATPPFDCPLALSGFGDPPPGKGGVIITSSFQALSAPAFSIAFTPTPPSEIPLPPAFFLFVGGLASLAAARRAKA